MATDIAYQHPGLGRSAAAMTMDNPTLHGLDKRITSHEAVCSERYANLIARMSRMELIVLAVNGFVTSGLILIAAYFINKGLHP